MIASHEEGGTLIEKANACARSMVVRWIRNVFREVSLQVLKRLWKISHRDEKNVTLEVTHDHLDACERTCERLGRLWCQRLRDNGQAQVAEWVREVTERKRFWESDDVVWGEEFPRSGQGEATRTLLTPTRGGSVEAGAADTSSQLQTSDCKLISTKLRRLGEQNSAEGPPPLGRVIRLLDDVGCRGETSWPYGWSIIQEAARNNTKRLHSETIKGRPRIAPTNPEYEVIPKSLVGSEQVQNAIVTAEALEIDAVLSSRSKRLTTMMERKRKATSEPSAELQVEEEHPAQSDPPRAPSQVGKEERWSWKESVVASLSKPSRQELERDMIHPDEEDIAVDPDCVVGALKDVGRFHLHIQQSTHGISDEEPSDKRQRRQLRKARKERLYPNVVDEKYGKKKDTKVIRTTSENHEHWMELDMGECLMEIILPNANKKIVCAFSSLEIMLKDEDASNNEGADY